MENTRKIYMLTFITFLLGTAQFVIVGILDKVAASVNVSLSSAGQLITIFALANAIGTPIIMLATARMNQRKRLLLGFGIMLLGSLGTVTLPGYNFLMLSRILLGVGNGFFVATAYSLAPKMAPAGREVRAMSNVAIGFSASLVFGVPIGRIVASSFDWKVIFWGIGFFTLLGIFSIARTIPPMEGDTPVPIGKQLALLKNLKNALALAVTFFMFIGYSVVNTYITPFLTSVARMEGGEISTILFVLGIASLIGSKLGGVAADRIGITRTLVGGIGIQAICLALLSIIPGSVIVTVIFLVLWMVSAWTFVPPQNFNLISLAPDASGIILSVNNSFVQFGFAAGAAIGGVVVGGLSVMAITWVGAASVAFAAIVAAVSYGRAYAVSKAR
ncbi:MFS transporter [Neobacillus cucumis]|uniref:MFS transporter n=1 Tax=Neobacillus cucumis TaxID=1740721 RepID=UPI00203FFD59|nr:MFS transporter [Neobacillus cucumis]MCM3728826.1 MFS transporter [Neobacillus cucumis]